MVYVKNDDQAYIDIVSSLRNIVENINHDYNNHLCSLCFNVPAADDETIKKLNEMIGEAKLLFGYTISHLRDHIYVAWK
ncbi:unnamed protein product [Rotaria sp. Silwood2]|nr:unnamed protein product [Rotaria sp. Silwood2]CAF3910192.1 unnamed protein product [Rotaria sp. Silwood2]